MKFLKFFTSFLFSLLSLNLSAQSNYYVQDYDAYTSELVDIQRVVQDLDGFLWLATTNGLYRFDGYEMKSFRTNAGDSNALLSNVVSKIKREEGGKLRCLIEGETFVFDPHTYQYQKVDYPYDNKKTVSATAGSTQVRKKSKWPHQPDETFHIDRFGKTWTFGDIDAPHFADAKIFYADDQDNVWYFYKRHLYRVSFYLQNYKTLKDINRSCRTSYLDQQNRCWVTSRETKEVVIYDAEGQLLGYLSPSNKREVKIERTPCEFESYIYAIYQDRDGQIWFGSKPDGIYRLHETTEGCFNIEHFGPEQGVPMGSSIYDIAQDAMGRLWFCGFDGTLYCFKHPAEEHPMAKKLLAPTFNNTAQYRKFHYRNFLITRDQKILIATTSGLAVGDLSSTDLSRMKLHLHQSEPDRETSLYGASVTSLLQAADGTIYIGTDNGGVNQLLSDNLLADTLCFAHWNSSNHFPIDNVKSMYESNDHLWLVTLNRLIEWNPKDSLPEAVNVRLRIPDTDFAENKPIELSDGTTLFGMMDKGCVCLNLDDIREDNQYPPIRLTSMADQDTIRIEPENRELLLKVAALDYSDPLQIRYCMRLKHDGKNVFCHVGSSREVLLPCLSAGQYTLQVRSTNALGEWVGNRREFIIQVEPTFWESLFHQNRWAWMVGGLGLLAVACLLYIHRHVITRKISA